MRYLWNVVAMLCLAAALAFWWRGHADYTFVCAAIGVVAWFLNLRNRLNVVRIEAEDGHLQSEIENEVHENQDVR